MDGYGGGGNVRDSSNLEDLASFGANPTGSAVFNASQYEFFGGDVLEEVELGGLEDEEDDLAPVGFEEEEFQFDKEEGDVLGPISEIDDLSSTFSELNKVAGGPTNARVSKNWGSRESSSTSELARDTDYNNWLDQRSFEGSTKWPPHSYSSSARFMEPNSLYRTSSYPEQQQQHPQPLQSLRHQHSSEPILIPTSPFTSYPPPGGRSHQASPNSQPNNIPYRPQIPAPKFSSLSNSQLQMSVSPHQFGGNLAQLPPGLPVNSQLQNFRPNQAGLYTGNHPGLPDNFSNGLVHPQMTPPKRTGMQHHLQPSIAHLQAQILSPHLSASPPNFQMHGLPDLRDQRAVAASLLPRARHPMMRHPHLGGSNSMRFKSKYMSVDEIENIHRMQLAATLSNDPYSEDYYHQAILARKTAGSKLRHHFCPTNLRDNSSKPQSSNEPHPFLQVDALGRVSFSSIRRPRPLLEVDPPKPSQNGAAAELKISVKPLEQEPMLAARVAIEDGICLLLDVDDIDRFLQFNHLPDGGAQLRQRRQLLLEGLASSLQLVDPLARNGHAVNLSPGDDFVFLRLVSLPKGKKLLRRYLEVLPPGQELDRVVCMAVFRNLRFLFGNVHADHELSMVVASLARAASSCVHRMELKSLAACLASVVCSAESPPLRPIGHAAGDGASVVLRSVLERATELLTGPCAVESCSVHHRAFWQASFDSFFGLLTKYSFNKYDSLVQSSISHGSSDDLPKKISREMPVELLRASLPHTSEQQRKLLLEFVQRSMPVMGFGGGS